MDLLSRAGAAGLNLSHSLTDQAHRVAALSTGLRISNAADDPSGLAISQSIASHVAGLQHGQENVQNATNLLNVAQGSLTTVSDMLQRMRALAVAAATDFQSANDLRAIQTEIEALKTQINAVATKASFNGVHLFDGSLDASQKINAFVQEIEAAPVSGAVPTRTVVNADGLGNPGLLVQNATVSNGVEAATIQIAVTGYDAVNAVDPVTGPIGGPGLYVQVTAYSIDPSFGAGQQITTVTAIPQNGGPLSAIFTSPSGSSSFFQFTLANLTGADVGAAQAFTTYHDLPAATGAPLSVNYGGSEGTILQLSIPKLTTENIGVSSISVVAPTTVDIYNVPQGVANSNATAAVDAEVRVSAAIQIVAALQAQVGAQTVALQADQNNAAIQQVAEAASQSAITDANMSAESTGYTRDAVMIHVAQSAIISAQDGAKSFAATMSASIAGPPAHKTPNAPATPSTPDGVG